MTLMMGEQLTGISRCPHCSVANPQLVKRWLSDAFKGAKDQLKPKIKGSAWGGYACTTCGGVVLAKSKLILHTLNNDGVPIKAENPKDISVVDAYFPQNRAVKEELPESAKKYLSQALESLNSPDGAVMLAASAVDAMLKDKGYDKGSLYERIDQAVKDGVLTEGMSKWAHKVRLDANNPRHVDNGRPHLDEQSAKQAIDFVEALGEFLFVLPRRVEEGLQAAKKASEAS